MKNKERGRGTIVQSFSVPLRKAALIEEVSEMAARQGLTFSSLVVKLLEDYNQQKNQEALVELDLSPIKNSPTNILSKHQEINQVLDQWINTDLNDMDIKNVLEIKPRAAHFLAIIAERERKEKVIHWKKY